MKNIIEQGAFIGEPLNIRGGKSRPPYTWGPSAGHSRILKDLGLSDGKGKILKPELLDRFQIDSRSVAERWYNTDDPQFPSRTKIEGQVIALNELVFRRPEEVLGKSHIEAYGPSMSMVMKDLDAAEPLSWQMHIGIAEGYEVENMPEGTGFLLGPVEPAAISERRRLTQNARRMLQGRDPRVVRLKKQVPGIETPDLFNKKGLDALIEDLLAGMRDDIKIPDLVKHFLLEGMNVIDVMGFALEKNGKLNVKNSLIQIYFPKPGERIVTRERMPHALFGRVSAYGEGAVACLTEFKQTASNQDQARNVRSSSQTWSLADNLMGKMPRPGKVTRTKLKEAFQAMETPGSAVASGLSRKSTWRAISPDYFKPGTGGDSRPKKIAPGVRRQWIHQEAEYGALKIFMDSGARAVLQRSGRHSALKVRQGAVRIKDLKGKILIPALGFDGKGWDGSNSDEAVIFASEGNIIIESIGLQNAVLYDAIRPLPGGAGLPELAANPA